MALTYMKTERRVDTKVVQKTLEIPSGWGMFSAQGNSRMKAKAVALVGKLEKTEDYIEHVKAFAQYFKAYRSACKSKSEVMDEAGDTAVRETVWEFAIIAGRAVEVSEGTLDDLWEQYR